MEPRARTTALSTNETRAYIGTSGYSYKHWKNVLYPSGLATSRWLEFYSRTFNSVELNVTFYRLPKRQTFETWKEQTPPHFRFVIKGSRYITHLRRLLQSAEALDNFFTNAAGLGKKLICVLWQLPPSMKMNIQRLDDFLHVLKEKYGWCRHSFEFRNPSWFTPQTYECLTRYDASLCIADSPRASTPVHTSATFLYLRFHGGRVLYGSEYSRQELAAWATNAARWMRGKTVLFAFFNNDAQGFAVKNAQMFKELINEKL